MDDFRTEVDEHGNIKVTSYVEAVVLSKEEQEQARRIFEQLQDENAKLREQVTQLQSEWESERDYADQMEAKEKRAVAENTKLRELAKAAWILFLKHGAVGPYELPEVDRVRESLNELGIKVSWEELGIEVDV